MNWDLCAEKAFRLGADGKPTEEVIGKIPTFECIPVFFSEITYWAFVAAGSIAAIIIIWAGIKYIRSGGDQKQVQSARSTLTFGIIGLIVVLSSIFIINIIAYVSGAKCITRFGFKTCETELQTHGPH